MELGSFHLILHFLLLKLFWLFVSLEFYVNFRTSLLISEKTKQNKTNRQKGTAEILIGSKLLQNYNDQAGVEQKKSVKLNYK